jgi:hypothetical protein
MFLGFRVSMFIDFKANSKIKGFLKNQGFRFSSYLGFEVFRNRGFEISSSRNQGLRVMRFLGFKNSSFEDFRVSGFY